MIELHPEGAGSPILGDWKEAPALYLVGGSSGFRFCSCIQPGDMPVAVACRNARSVVIAPVHPLCHVSAAGQAITALSLDESLQLGSEKFRIRFHALTDRKKLMRRWMVWAVLLAAAAVSGWFIHDVFASGVSAVATTDLYTF